MRHATIAALLALIIPIAAAAQNAPPAVCKDGAGGNRYCETRFRDIRSTLATDAGGRPISLTVDGKRDTESNTLDAMAYIGTMMAMLEPASTQDSRAAAMARLIDGARGAADGRGHARFGGYDLTLRFDRAELTFYVDRKK